MQKALQEAEKAFEAGEVPVGAIITINEKIIAKAHNLTEMLHDVTAHAEIQAITSASEYLGGKYLKDCTLYVTLEPCVMCAGALYWSQIGRLWIPSGGITSMVIYCTHVLRLFRVFYRTNVVNWLRPFSSKSDSSLLFPLSRHGYRH